MAMALTITGLQLLFLLLSKLLTRFTVCQIPPNKVTMEENRDTWRPSSPLVGDDGKVYSCHGKILLAFQPNGTVAWALPLGYRCRPDSTLLTDGYGKIYLIAEDRVIKVTPSNVESSEKAVEVFFGPESNIGASGRIVGICISLWSSMMFINIEKRGIFAFSLLGQPLWIVGPLIYRFGYPQGCRENATTNCYFSSPPSCDQCEGTLYISNNEGQLYCMYTRSPNFRWIQDLSFVDRSFTLTPGNNGRLYVTFPKKGILMALDAKSGDILWKNIIGPLSSEENKPVVDFSGWVSIGSSDGYLYSFSPKGKPKNYLKAAAIDSTIHSSPFLGNSGFAIYVAQTKMDSKVTHMIDQKLYVSAMKPLNILFSALVPATGTVFWTGKYPGELSSLLSRSELHRFRFDERIILALLASSGTKEFSTSLNTRQKLGWTCSQTRPEHPNIYTASERAILLFLLFQLTVITLMALFVRFCCIFWKKKKVKELSLSKFIAKRHALHLKRKSCIKKISELELEPMATEAIEELRNAVQKKEMVEKRLSTTYSLGRDGDGSKHEGVLPLYGGKHKSYSFHGANTESLTIFNELSDASASSEGSESESCESNGSSRMLISTDTKAELEMIAKGKAPIEDGPSTSKMGGHVDEDVPSVATVEWISGGGFEMAGGEGGIRKKDMWLKRRTLSSTN